MASSPEPVGITACITAIVAAYHECGVVIQKLKAQRAAKRLPAPPRILEETIDQAPQEIEKEKSRGIQRFGKAFQDGDHVAIIALQQVTIQLQGTLLDGLKHTAFDEQVTDFSAMVDAADMGRDKTIGILLGLRQRLLGSQNGANVQDPDSLPVPVKPARAERQSSTPEDLRILLEKSGALERKPQPIRNSKTWTREYSSPQKSPRENSSTDGVGDGAQSNQHLDPNQPSDKPQTQCQPRHRHGSLLSFFQRVRTQSNPGQLQPPDDEHRRTSTSNASSGTLGDAPDDEPSRRSSDGARLTHEAGDERWSRKSNSEDSSQHGTLPIPPYQTGDQKMESARTSNTNLVRVPSSVNLQQTTAPGAGAAAVPQPTPENDYLGFCKGAWKLQNGDKKAVQKSKEFNDGWSQSAVYCLTCTSGKCAFAGHIALNVIWTKVWNVDVLGLSFRWPFLAKSHVSQPKVKDRKFYYQCLFCVFLGLESPQLLGTDPYMEHVSKEHRGRPISDVVLYKCGCVAGHVCDESEEFDINIFPLTTAEQATLDLKMRDETRADAAAASSLKPSQPDKQDSMFSEPWNEGLSDFHYGGEMEKTEREI